MRNCENLGYRATARTVPLFAGMLLSAWAFAADYTWTGRAGNGRWTDPGNWSPSGVPGCYVDSDDVVWGADSTDTATFGADSGGTDAVVIDLAGQKYVKSVIIAAGAPSYTFGTSASVEQSLGINTNGSIVVAKEVATDQIFPWVRVNSNGATTFSNLSPMSTFRFGNLDSLRRNGTNPVGGYPYASLTLGGTGDYAMIGSCKFDQCSSLFVDTSGKLTFDDQSGTSARYSTFYTRGINSAVHEIELPTASSRIRGNGGSFPWSDSIQFQENTHVYGLGAIAVPVPFNMPVETPGQPARLWVGSGKTAEVDCAIIPHPNYVAVKDLVLFANGAGGTFLLNGTNTLAGALRIFGAHTVVGARLLGNKGCSAAETSIPRGDQIVFESNWTGKSSKHADDNKYHVDSITQTAPPGGTLKYTGVADGATDRQLMVSNAYATVNAGLLPTNTFANAGQGAFTLNSEIVQSPESRGASFRLKAENAPLVFSGRFVGDETHFWNLLVDGPETVTVTQTQDYTGFTSLDGGTLVLSSLDVLPNTSGYVMNGGTLRLSQGKGNVDKPISVLRAGGGIVLPENAGMVELNLTCAAGAGLAFTIPVGTSLKASNLPTGPLDSALFSVNGMAAKVTEDGLVVAAVSHWAAAVDGNWNETAKWTPSAPMTSDTVLIDATSDSGYEVRVTDASANGMKDVRVANGAILAFDTDYELKGQSLKVGTNGTVTVSAGRGFAVTKDTRGGVDLAPGAVFRIEPNATGVLVGVTADYIDQHGGTYDIGGRLVFCKKDVGNRFHVRDGGAVVRDGGVLGDAYNGNATLSIAPRTAGGTAELTIEPGGKFALNQGQMLVGDDVRGGRSVLNIDGKSVTTSVYESNNVYGFGVGCKNGLGELNVRGGKLDVGNYGLFVGCLGYATTDADNQATPCCPTGVVNISRGDVRVYGYGWHYAAFPCGLLIGNGLFVPKQSGIRSASRFRGELNLTGGSLLTSVGATVVGGGLADGELNVAGGTFSQNGYNTFNELVSHCPLVIGMEGGTGRMTVSSGSATVTYQTFVGGAYKRDLEHTTIRADYYPVVANAATGTLVVVGGSFSCDGTGGRVIVGADGVGTLEIGGAGKFSCRDLVLSNNVASVLQFDLPATRRDIAWSAVCTNLVITSGAKLTIDASKFTGAQFPLTKLLTVRGAVSGTFASEQLEVVCSPEQAKLFRDAEILTELDGEKGLWLKGRPNGTMVLFR